MILLFVATQVEAVPCLTHQVAKHPTCVSNVEKEAIGPTLASLDQKNMDLSLELKDLFDYEQNSCCHVFRQKLRSNLTFWRETVKASSFILDVLENGYKLIFLESPAPFFFENRSSAIRHKKFVEEAIFDLIQRGCIREVDVYPEFCNPLHVAEQSSGKLRLILDLSHLNTFLVKKRVKYEDLRTVLQVFSQGSYAFTSDLLLYPF